MQNTLQHHGILGQKWGVRRYQNPDGTLTEAGRNRYISSVERKVNAIQKDINSFSKIPNGVKTKSGKEILTKDDVNESVKGLKSTQQKIVNKASKHYQKKIDALQKDIDSFEEIKDGVVLKNGKVILSKEDVQQSVNSLIKKKQEYSEAKQFVDKLINKESFAPNSDDAFNKLVKNGSVKDEINRDVRTGKPVSDRFYGVVKDEINRDVRTGNPVSYRNNLKKTTNIVSRDKEDYIENQRLQGARVTLQTETQKKEELKRRNKMGMYNGNKSNW